MYIINNIMISLIVCVDNKWGISKNGIIPWKFKSDMNFFRDMTTYKHNNNKNVLIVGKNTLMTMSEIKDREIISVSSTTNKTLTEAIEKAKILEPGRIFICGGKRIYEEAIGTLEIQQMYVTVINKDYECDNNVSFLSEYIDFSYDRKRKNNFSEKLPCYETTENDVTLEFRSYINYPKGCELRTINEYEDNYLNMLYDIIKNGDELEGRNGKVWSQFGNVLEFDLKKGFPLLTTKKTFWKGVVEELAFFLKGKTDTKELINKGIKIWEPNTNVEFLKKMNLPYDEYDMGPMYGFNLVHFGEQYKGCDKKYKGYNQIKYCINLLKTDPFSRRIIMTTYNPAQAKEGVLYPCHGISIMFKVTKNFELNCLMTQRSADMCCGVPFNIASYALLVHLLCNVVNNTSQYKYTPGKLKMIFNDAHVYKEHYDNAIRQILRKPYAFPQLIINKKMNTITDFSFEDLELIDYNCYGVLNYKMIA